MSVSNDEIISWGRNCGNCFYMKVVQVKSNFTKRLAAQCKHPYEPVSHGMKGWMLDTTQSKLPKKWLYALHCEYYMSMSD